MKIAYLMPTRGNPRRALAAIEVAKTLSSGKHQIDFRVGIDNDDSETLIAFENENDIGFSVADRPFGLGSVWNRLAALAQADIYCVMADDIFVATPYWDDLIANALYPKNPAIIAWTDNGSPNQPTYPIVTDGWYRVAGLWTEHFPYWFDDTWMAEVWSFMTGGPIPIVPQLQIASLKGKTKRMRDLYFWWSFFASRRPERMQRASRLRESFGLPPLPALDIEVIRRQWELRDFVGMAKAEETQAALSAGGDPTPEYLEAKRRAESFLEAA